MNQRKLMLNASALLIVAVCLTSCEKNLVLSSSNQTETSPRATFNSRTLTWTGRANQSQYPLSTAENDFGDLTGWDQNNASINSETVRVKLLANKIAADGGMITNIDIPDGASYLLKFRVKFNNGFQWGKGGKVGFGFKIGEGYTGGNDAGARSGDGASVRITWGVNSSAKAKLKPYLYYKDMPADSYGDGLGITYPSNTNTGLVIDNWYLVEILVKCNTYDSSRRVGRTDGTLIIKIKNNSTGDTETLVNRNNFRYTSTGDASKSLIKELTFHTFRGGNTLESATSEDGTVAYDNVSWQINPSN